MADSLDNRLAYTLDAPGNCVREAGRSTIRLTVAEADQRMRQVFTIGHSNHALADFLSLLRRHRIDTICDVRSQPYSRRYPHFSRPALQQALEEAGVHYEFRGAEFGARPADAAFYADGRVQFDRLAQSPAFGQGLERLLLRLHSERLVLMCAERDPITCHRMLLVTRALRRFDVGIHHLRADGTLEANSDAEARLLATVKLGTEDLLSSRQELIEQAYDLQASKIALHRP